MTGYLVRSVFRGPDGWFVVCTCGHTAKAPDQPTVDRMVAQHTIAHQVVEAHS